MRIVVLGANSQLGHDILRYHSANASNRYLVPLTRADLDLTHLELVKPTLSALDFDVLVNCCAYTDVELAEVEQEKAFSLNSNITELLAEVCKQKKSRLIHISTDYVFDGEANCPYRESDDTNPLNVYGKSKLEGEQRALSAYDDVVILRTASLFGIAGTRGTGRNFLYSILNKVKNESRLAVVHDQIMNPTWTYHLAEIISNVIENNVPGGVYHATSNGFTSWYNLAQYALDYMQISASVTPIRLSDFDSRVVRPLNTAFNCDLLQNYINPIPCWKESVENFLDLI